MYFNNVEKFPIRQLITNNKKIYAHVLKERKETLEEHVELAIKYLHKIIDSKNIDLVLYNFEDKLVSDLSEQGKTLYREMLYNTIYLHDIGKINCNFQYQKMNNNEFKNKDLSNSNNSKHSMLSSLIYINHYFDKIKNNANKEDRNKLLVFLLLNSYAISKHHSSLDSFKEYKEKLLEDGEEGKRLYTDECSLYNSIYQVPIIFSEKEGLLKQIFRNVENILINMEVKEKGTSIYLYIYERFITSLLLACDYYATSEFKHQKEIENFGAIEDTNKFYDIFKNTDINRKIRKYQNERQENIEDLNNKDINKLRNELFIEAEDNLLKNTEQDIFYLEAPTGSGKAI